MNPSQEIADRLAGVRLRIAAACDSAGRDPASVRLVAVSKTMSAERIRQVTAAGQRLLGENRVQEALDKMPAVGPDAVWHLIGHLQRNKARHAIGRFDLIHTVDDARLAVELDRRSALAGLRQGILVQVNVSGEATKSGVAAAALPALLDRIAPLAALDLRGLMTIPPAGEGPDQASAWFRALRRLRDRAETALSRPLPELSMGMSQDFEAAIAEGATLVRVGRAIFGDRP